MGQDTIPDFTTHSIYSLRSQTQYYLNCTLFKGIWDHIKISEKLYNRNIGHLTQISQKVLKQMPRLIIFTIKCALQPNWLTVPRIRLKSSVQLLIVYPSEKETQESVLEQPQVFPKTTVDEDTVCENGLKLTEILKFVSYSLLCFSSGIG